MNVLLKEPLLFIQIGGMTLVQALMGLYTAFGGNLTVQQVTAINGFATIVLTILSRMTVMPTAIIPPAVVQQIADDKAKAKEDKEQK